ncbi:MAG: DNA-directed RNA polymerase subunit alpha [Rickettsiales bacterium]|jgi:DNA-directed RNA polymerase subunit alpha|nr:DNA-directed RNA polymerase subunit alpha [Rickettsiales bacterium]
MVNLQNNWNNLINTPEVEIKKISDTEAIFIAKPLEKGYGITLGNALRRVLLSSIGGFAVTSVKINGVFHEYDTIEGIREDVYEIIMNIKNILFTKETTTPSKLVIKVHEKGEVLARDIKIENGGEILNRDFVICNIEKSGISFEAEMVAEYGIGYQPASFTDSVKEAGVIKIDSLFNLVENVSYKVTDARQGNKINYDMLELKVKTKKTIDPLETISFGAKILQSQLDIFTKFNDFEKKVKKVEATDKKNEINPSFLKKIEDIDLSVRSFNCLKAMDINCIGDLIQKQESEMTNLPNFGKKSLTEIKETLKSLGLSFGTIIPNWEKIIEDKNK